MAVGERQEQGDVFEHGAPRRKAPNLAARRAKAKLAGLDLKRGWELGSGVDRKPFILAAGVVPAFGVLASEVQLSVVSYAANAKVKKGLVANP